MKLREYVICEYDTIIVLYQIYLYLLIFPYMVVYLYTYICIIPSITTPPTTHMFMFSLLVACFFKPREICELPDELISYILVEFLGDEPQNRLVNRRIRRELDRKYSRISDNSIPLNRPLVNLNAVMRLKARDRQYERISDYLMCEDQIVRRMCVKLMSVMNLKCTVNTRCVLRLFKDSETLKAFERVLKITGLRMDRLPGELKARHERLVNEDRIERNFMLYYPALRLR